MTMSTDIAALLTQEELTFDPSQGAFDPKTIGDFILTLGAPWQDPQRPEIFLVFLSPQSRDDFLSAHDPAAERNYPYVLLIDVSPQQVYINQFAGERYLGLSEQFIRWLLSTYECRINADDEQAG
jgi:hypothetical protein